MKKLLQSLAVVCLLALAASAQGTQYGQISAAASTCTAGVCVQLALASNTGAVGVDISGTFTGTLQFEISFDNGTNWRAISMTPVGSTTTVTSATSGGAWRAAVSGATTFRVRASAMAVPTAVVNINSSVAAASVGGGVGTVSFSSGGTTANVLPKGTGVANTLADSKLTDDGTTLAYSGTGGFSATGTNGGFSSPEGTGAGLTAGAGTDLMWADSTAHAFKANYNNVAVGIVATEARTNTFSVAQIFPAGAANSISLKFGATATEGLAAPSTSYLATSNGTNFTTIFGSGASGFGVRSVDLFSWSNSTTTANAATDTGISRGNPGIVDIGTGAAASTAGTANLATIQYRGLAQTAFVTGDFTTSGSGTALEAITGLTWTFPASTAINARIDCYLTYHQNVANVAVAFGFQDASVAPTNLMANALMSTSATAHTEGTIAASVATSATAIVSATPSAITTNWQVQLHFFIEQPSNAGTSIFTIRTSTATQADTVTVVRGSYCELAQ